MPDQSAVQQIIVSWDMLELGADWHTAVHAGLSGFDASICWGRMFGEMHPREADRRPGLTVGLKRCPGHTRCRAMRSRCWDMPARFWTVGCPWHVMGILTGALSSLFGLGEDQWPGGSHY